MFFSLLQNESSAQGGSMLMTVLPFVLIIAIFYFFIIRPQNKKQKETEKMINALKKGDKVVTIGGIHGVVSSTKEKTVIVKVDDNTKLEFNRSAIATVVTDKPVSAKSDKKSKSEEKAKDEEKSEDKSKTEDNSDDAFWKSESDASSKTEEK